MLTQLFHLPMPQMAKLQSGCCWTRSPKGGAAGNLKSIGGSCGLRAGMRDNSFGFIGLGPPDPVRWFLIGRSTSTRRLLGDGFIGDSGGCKPRTECRPTERFVSHVSYFLFCSLIAYPLENPHHSFHSVLVRPVDLQNDHGLLAAAAAAWND